MCRARWWRCSGRDGVSLQVNISITGPSWTPAQTLITDQTRAKPSFYFIPELPCPRIRSSAERGSMAGLLPPPVLAHFLWLEIFARHLLTFQHRSFWSLLAAATLIRIFPVLISIWILPFSSIFCPGVCHRRRFPIRQKRSWVNFSFRFLISQHLSCGVGCQWCPR